MSTLSSIRVLSSHRIQLFLLLAVLISLVLIISSWRSSSATSSATMSSSSTGELVKVDFEVYGRVQGVFFRKYTQEQGSNLGLKGFCRNTSNGTVSGTMEGPKTKIEQMKDWLRTVGSPSSRIEKAEFRNEQPIQDYTYKKFGVERTI